MACRTSGNLAGAKSGKAQAAQASPTGTDMTHYATSDLDRSLNLGVSSCLRFCDKN